MFRKSLVLLLSLVLCCTVIGCGKSETVTAYEELVAQIGNVTLESEEAILEAEKAYEALSDSEKEQVASSLEILTDSRETYDKLCEEAILQAKIEEVENCINAIGAVSLESEATIKTAQDLMKGLSADEQAMVANASVLEDAQSQFDELKQAKKEQLYETYVSNFEVDEDRVEGITWYMHEKMPEYIDERCYIIPYIGVRGDDAWICIRYDYTEEDWIFWEKLTIVTDNEKYIKVVGPFDTVRDNDGGVVWEWYDECLDINQGLDTGDLQMLKDIAGSEETIIRFEGDEYAYDYIVSSTDKAIITDVLGLYEGLMN